MGKIQQLRKIKSEEGWSEAAAGVYRFSVRQSPKLIRYPARYGFKKGIPFYVYEQFHRFKRSNTSGDLIWDSNWDLLIILDCCRYEWLKQVSKEYPWIKSVESKKSVGSNSRVS